MIRGVIFDMDGILVDSEIFYKKALENFLEKYNIEFSEEIHNKLVGLDTDSLYSIIYDYTNGIFSSKQEMITLIEEEFENQEVNIQELAYNDALSLIKDLKSMGYPLALASNADREIIMEILDQLKISNYFDVISSAEDYKEGKPHPEIYLDTSKKMFLKPEDVLIVEDSDVGIDAANASGAVVVCRKEEYFNFPQNTEYKFKDLRNIKSLIEEFNKDVRTYPVPLHSKDHLKALFFIQNFTSEEFNRKEPHQIIIQEDNNKIQGVIFIEFFEDEMKIDNWFLNSLDEEDLEEFFYEIRYIADQRNFQKINWKDKELESRYLGEIQ